LADILLAFLTAAMGLLVAPVPFPLLVLANDVIEPSTPLADLILLSEV